MARGGGGWTVPFLFGGWFMPMIYRNGKDLSKEVRKIGGFGKLFI
jgi:hypothetical protein